MNKSLLLSLVLCIGVVMGQIDFADEVPRYLAEPLNSDNRAISTTAEVLPPTAEQWSGSYRLLNPLLHVTGVVLAYEDNDPSIVDGDDYIIGAQTNRTAPYLYNVTICVPSAVTVDWQHNGFDIDGVSNHDVVAYTGEGVLPGEQCAVLYFYLSLPIPINYDAWAGMLSPDFVNAPPSFTAGEYSSTEYLDARIGTAEPVAITVDYRMTIDYQAEVVPVSFQCAHGLPGLDFRHPCIMDFNVKEGYQVYEQERGVQFTDCGLYSLRVRVTFNGHSGGLMWPWYENTEVESVYSLYVYQYTDGPDDTIRFRVLETPDIGDRRARSGSTWAVYPEYVLLSRPCGAHPGFSSDFVIQFVQTSLHPVSPPFIRNEVLVARNYTPAQFDIPSSAPSYYDPPTYGGFGVPHASFWLY